MKILHFILGKANLDRSNGVNHVIHGLCKNIALTENEIKVIGVSKGMKESSKLIEREKFQVIVFNKFFGECFETLKRETVKVDIVHLHSVWNNYNIIFARYLISINKPYVVTIHSGLTEDRIRQSRYWIKLLYHKFAQKYIFDKASGIHAITREEMTGISKYTKNKNIFFVSNGIDLDNYKLQEKSYKAESEIIRFGYLGRFGIEKNIHSLILAISQLPKIYLNKVKCTLIGPIGKEGNILRRTVKDLKLENHIEFTGALYGDEKQLKLKIFDFYVHPSYSDVVSIAVMEAMANGLPCVITRTSQVSYYYKTNSFIMVEPIVQDIKRGLIEMMDKRNEWQEMSVNSISLINSVFNWCNATELMINEYQKILISNSKHKC